MPCDSPDTPDQPRMPTAHPDLDALSAALQELRAVSSAAAASNPSVRGFNPAAGWLTAEGSLALLELTTGRPRGGEILVVGRAAPTEAVALIDRLFRDSADLTLACAQTGSNGASAELAVVMAEISRQLELGYRLVFDRRW